MHEMLACVATSEHCTPVPWPCRIAQYHQHLTELLDPETTPLEYMMKEFNVPIEKTRSMVGWALTS